MLYDPSHLILQGIDYLAYRSLSLAHPHVSRKDAEFLPNGRTGVYGGYFPGLEPAGRFRSLGDGQVDSPPCSPSSLSTIIPGWAVVEWECALKHPEDGAREGAKFVREHIIRVTTRRSTISQAASLESQANRRLLGLSSKHRDSSS